MQTFTGCAILLLAGVGHVLTAAAAEAPGPGPGPPEAASSPDLVVDREVRSLRLEAVLQRHGFEREGGADAHYHAVVNRKGSAAARALFVTDVSDGEVAAALRSLGAEDGGGVPLRAWTLRRLPFLPWPAARVRGSRIEVSVEWEGAGRPHALAELLEDSGGRGIEMRFGGNEEHDEHWDSGCILCLFSCPGGVVSNGSYSIRDHVRGTTRFGAADRLPVDGTSVTVTLQLFPD